MPGKCPPGCQCNKHVHVVKTSYEKVCEECEQSFTAKYSNTRFCSGLCNQRSYERRNREKIRAGHRQRQAARRVELREYRRQWAEANKEHIAAQKRAKYDADSADPEKAERRRQAQRAYYLKNRDRLLDQKRTASRKAGRADALRHIHGPEGPTLFDTLWAAQDGKCYLCGEQLRPDLNRQIHLDHDHSCCPLGRSCERCRRGLACKPCNLIIGMAGDDAGKLARIAANLQQANALVQKRMLLPREPRLTRSHDFVCEECGEKFTASRSDARCCSQLCYGRLRQRERAEARGVADCDKICAECGAAFASKRGTATYCTKRCSNRARLRRLEAEGGALTSQPALY
jgi:Recombination endonuclease VII